MTKQEKRKVLLPKATALWLIDNTSLTFKQIADFCDLTEIEVKMIADGVLANTIYPVSPIESGDLTMEEISNREKDGKALTNTFSSGVELGIQKVKQKKFISSLQKHNRPDAILWLVSKYPELSDSQIIKLVRTTKNMVRAIREKNYKNYDMLLLKDPVLLGFCSQTELNNEVKKAQEQMQRQNKQTNDKIEQEQKKVIKKINVNQVRVAKIKIDNNKSKKPKSNTKKRIDKETDKHKKDKKNNKKGK